MLPKKIVIVTTLDVIVLKDMMHAAGRDFAAVEIILSAVLRCAVHLRIQSAAMLTNAALNPQNNSVCNIPILSKITISL